MIVVYVIIGLIALVLLISAMLPKSYNVEKSTIINKSVSDVMNRVGDLNHYSKWNPWQQMDPNAKSTITGTPKTPGHRYGWEGKKVGVGSLTLRDIDNKHIHFDLEFLKPFKAKAKDNWQNSGELPWPMASLMGPKITKDLNVQSVTGLNNLKKLCEG